MGLTEQCYVLFCSCGVRIATCDCHAGMGATTGLTRRWPTRNKRPAIVTEGCDYCRRQKVLREAKEALAASPQLRAALRRAV